MLDDYLQFVNYMLMSGCTESWWCVTRVLASRHLLLTVSTLCQLPPAQRSDLALEKVTRASHSHQPRDAGLPPACPCHVSIQRFVIFFSEFMGWHHHQHHRLVLSLKAKDTDTRYCHRSEPDAWVCGPLYPKAALSPVLVAGAWLAAARPCPGLCNVSS